jgi:hypothetical protein
MPRALFALSTTDPPDEPWSSRSWPRPTWSVISWPVDLVWSGWRPLWSCQCMILGTRSGEGGDGDGQTYRASLSPASVKVSLVFCEVDLVESGMSPSLALVWKSLRPKSDMMIVVWWCFLEGWKVVVGRLQKFGLFRCRWRIHSRRWTLFKYCS